MTSNHNRPFLRMNDHDYLEYLQGCVNGMLTLSYLNQLSS